MALLREYGDRDREESWNGNTARIERKTNTHSTTMKELGTVVYKAKTEEKKKNNNNKQTNQKTQNQQQQNPNKHRNNKPKQSMQACKQTNKQTASQPARHTDKQKHRRQGERRAREEPGVSFLISTERERTEIPFTTAKCFGGQVHGVWIAESWVREIGERSE